MKALSLLLILVAGVIFIVHPPSVQAGDLLSTPSEKSSPAFHQHLVLPGKMTSYVLRLHNAEKKPIKVTLSVTAAPTEGWTVELKEQEVSAIAPGAVKDVLLSVRAGDQLPPGKELALSVKAVADGGQSDEAEMAAKTTDRPKVIFVALDALHPEYVNLNAQGTGPGKPGDWLTPNLHRLMDRGAFYPNSKVHIISATDMNHFNFLAGTYTGTGGISLVGGELFGFDKKGHPEIRPSPLDINFYGPDKKRVETLFTAAKQYDPQAYNMFVSGKNWVPDMLLAPEQKLDRVIHGEKVPDYLADMRSEAPRGWRAFRRLRTAMIFGPQREASSPDKFVSPPEARDRRMDNVFTRLISAFPNRFPSDAWVMSAALRAINNEDPDVMYILLGGVDDAGHAYGSAHDLKEWDERGTPSVSDDISCYDARASRQGVLQAVREADAQVGRLLDFLAERKALDSTLLIAESDHNMVTYYRKPLDMRDRLKKSRFSDKTDFFFGTAASIGVIFARRENQEVLPEVEKILEAWEVKNPLSGKKECPVIVLNRKEMQSGIDAKDGRTWTLPGEYYSEYYCEHRQESDPCWPDILVMAAPHYKFKVQNFGLGNLGMADIKIPLPERGYFTGGHGSFETCANLLILAGPQIPQNVNFSDPVYNSDVAPTLYRLLRWPIPPCVNGKGLPGIDPGLKK